MLQIVTVFAFAAAIVLLIGSGLSKADRAKVGLSALGVLALYLAVVFTIIINEGYPCHEWLRAGMVYEVLWRDDAKNIVVLEDRNKWARLYRIRKPLPASKYIVAVEEGGETVVRAFDPSKDLLKDK